MHLSEKKERGKDKYFGHKPAEKVNNRAVLTNG